MHHSDAKFTVDVRDTRYPHSVVRAKSLSAKNQIQYSLCVADQIQLRGGVYGAGPLTHEVKQYRELVLLEEPKHLQLTLEPAPGCDFVPGVRAAMAPCGSPPSQ